MVTLFPVPGYLAGIVVGIIHRQDLLVPILHNYMSIWRDRRFLQVQKDICKDIGWGSCAAVSGLASFCCCTFFKKLLSTTPGGRVGDRKWISDTLESQKFESRSDALGHIVCSENCRAQERAVIISKAFKTIVNNCAGCALNNSRGHYLLVNLFSDLCSG